MRLLARDLSFGRGGRCRGKERESGTCTDKNVGISHLTSLRIGIHRHLHPFHFPLVAAVGLVPAPGDNARQYADIALRKSPSECLYDLMEGLLELKGFSAVDSPAPQRGLSASRSSRTRPRHEAVHQSLKMLPNTTYTCAQELGLVLSFES